LLSVNIYSTPRFCQAFQAAYYPQQSVQMQTFRLGSCTWQLPTINGRDPLVLSPLANQFIDFYEPVAAPSPIQETPTQYLPQACHGLVTLEQWQGQNLANSYEPSPTILLEEIGPWKMSKRTLRSYRKLEKEVGPIQFELHQPTPEVIQAGMDWKSAQYLRSGGADLFAEPAHVQMFQHLAESGLLLVSSLRAGDQLLAVHLGMLDEGRVYWWVPSYDTQYQRYAPGKILLELLIESSIQAGYREFDFLIGGEDYKWDYATHVRLVGEMGVRPLPVQLKRLALAGKAQAKAQVKAIAQASLGSFPAGQLALQRLRDQLRPRPTSNPPVALVQELS
jgi:CelD/BcsL family acetyltransferase involved in cellulose biosynthesis